MLAKITKRTVDAAKPGEFVWDRTLKGFGVKATATGKTYILQYRRGGRGSPTKRVTIGRHGAITPAQARDEATRLPWEPSPPEAIQRLPGRRHGVPLRSRTSRPGS